MGTNLAFVRLRQMLQANTELARKLDALESCVGARGAHPMMVTSTAGVTFAMRIHSIPY